jgi:general nucleoside transport system permease protein
VTTVDVAPATPWTRLKPLLRWVVVILAAPVIFGVFAFAKGADPLAMYRDVLAATVQPAPLQNVLVRASVLLLAALAVSVPARAGLLNVGGEGQIVIGAVAAGGVGLATDRMLPGGLVLVLMLVAGAAAGAAWAGIAATLRLTVQANEAITTLLLNFIAVDIMLALISDAWKDKSSAGAGQLASRELEPAARLPLFAGTNLNLGIVVALVALAALWWLLSRTAWGFQLRVVGGNAEAGRRAGLGVPKLLLSAMLVGGALAGLAGVIHVAGTEFKLRQELTTGFGYIGFLASWLAAHKPLRVALSALLLAAIVIGSGLRLQYKWGLPNASVNILMALVLLVVLGSRLRRKAA